MQIFIEPSDVLLFRDGRPFSAGEGHRARSLFPPTPNTTQGMIRSKILADRCGRYDDYKNGCNGCPKEDNCTLADEIGTPTIHGQVNYGKIELKGALLAQYQDNQLTPYFPIPADVVQVKIKDNSATFPQIRYLQPLKNGLFGENDLTHSTHLKALLWTDEVQPVEPVFGYWNLEEIQAYLLNNPAQNFTQTDTLYVKESRFGIAIDKGKQVTEEGKLYQIEMIRCRENIGLYMEMDGIQSLSIIPDPKTGLIAIGGENRAASYTKVQEIDWNNFQGQIASKLPKSDGFKLYFATPTIFNHGWLPHWIDSQSLSGQYNGIQVELITAAIPRYQMIGGWDVAHNRPKPTRRAIPAGSVYYFKSKASPEDILKAFHWNNLADDPNEAQIGFGLGLVGCWNYWNLE